MPAESGRSRQRRLDQWRYIFLSLDRREALAALHVIISVMDEAMTDETRGRRTRLLIIVAVVLAVGVASLSWSQWIEVLAHCELG